MIRIPLLASAFVVLGAASAFAQPAPGAPPMPPDGPGMGMARPPMGDGDGWMARHREGMAMMQKAAAFRFRRGDAEVDIKCAADESTQACVNAASTLIDKIFASTPH